MSIIDNALEKRTDWERKVGPDIGGPTPFTPPDFYSLTQHEDATQYYVRGKAWTCWLAANHRPLLPNTGHLTLSLDLLTDPNTLSACQEIEIDTRISIGGYDFNHSFRNNYLKGGQLQISDGTLPIAKWADTGVLFGKFDPRKWYSIALRYAFDPVRQTYRTERITIDDEWFDLSLPDLKTQKLGWKDGAHCQVQQDLMGNGGWYSIYTRNMSYEWE